MLLFFFKILRAFLSLRYSISLKWLEVFDTQHPVIVFPNHPALVDPMIVTSYIAKKKLLSPVMTETYFHTPGLGPIVRGLWAIPVGDIAKGWTIDDVKKAFHGISEAIKNKKNILLYPSWHVYVQPFEHIVGKKMSYEIIGMLDGDARVIIARTKWLWWSMWWKAYTWTSPSLINVVWYSIWYLIANLFFFIPKREVQIEFIDMTQELKQWHKKWLDFFNENLQAYYNQWWNEECKFIPHYYFYDDVEWKKEPQNIEWSIAELSISSGVTQDMIPPEIWDSVRGKIAEIKKIPSQKILFDTNLVIDLHADSLDMAEFKAAIQAIFPDASNPPIALIKTAGDLASMALWKLHWEEQILPVCFREKEEWTVDFSYISGETILTKFKKNFQNEKGKPFVYDTMTGMMTRDEFLLKSYVIAEYLKKYRWENIGIMLPALSATSLLLVGSYISGKIPVMLNWTVWEKSFSHCMNFAGLDTILTSRKFYEKISSPWLAQFEKNMVFIEDIIRDISVFQKIIALSKKSLFILPKSKSNTAVILFTSGSESLPKAVALTHENILSDIAWALSLVPFRRYETLIGLLPPFHSFGFTLNTIFPLVAPVQVTYTPDPNDARTIGKIIKHTHGSILSATPTFLRMILANNSSDMVSSVSYAFIGAEKCGDDVFSLFHEKCPEWVILEWYGITECSPIVTVNPISKQKKGSVGKLLPQVQCKILSLDGWTDVKTGEQGMVYVSGSSIFSWYIDPNIESPFEVFDTVKFYKTGDLGYLDADGFLFITGRLKRFIKIAGEMVSLPFIENILLEKYGNPEMSTLALEAKEENHQTTIVAFTTFDVSTEEINNYIHAHGASNLIKISSVQRLDAIPLLGTGKVDYRLLKSMF